MHIRDSLPDSEQRLGICFDILVASVFTEQVDDLIVLESSGVDDRGTEGV
jgi:hypothetical protein